ncbi:hypothetical protein C9374_013279 [Naegleria lovaniensis]|uniref:BZIP domain-containing protein n=1 Tax=Naegleria lovaniensis TaxID=51637 RepID=A0AA88KQH7_NAELO|nr:uncharacterized protein C9374_013279 [Naegleria lovaniensis]KAG2391794.1 hypothetical protein C9374_013279 [Naegleria lovaniensis]
MSSNNNNSFDDLFDDFINEPSDTILHELEQGSAFDPNMQHETTAIPQQVMVDPNMNLVNPFQMQQPQQQFVDFGALSQGYALFGGLPSYFMPAMIPQTTAVAGMFPILANSNAFASPTTSSLSPNSSIDSITLANSSSFNVADMDKPIVLLPSSSSFESVDSNSTSSSAGACQTTAVEKEPPKKKKKVTTRKKASSNNSGNSSGSDSEETKRKKAHRRKQEEIDDDMKRLQDLDKQTELTAEQKEEKKKLRNRYTAKVSRDKKKKELEDLRIENDNLRKERDSLKKQCEEHVQTINRLNLEVNRLAQIVNAQVRPSRTALKSLIVFIGVFVFIGLLAFLSGSYKFSSTMKSSVPERVAARRVARGLLTINNTSTEPNQATTTSPISKSVRDVVNSTPHKEHQQQQQNNDPLHEPVYVESTMEMGEMLDEFSGDGMYTYDVFYPTKIKRHFREFQSFNGPQKHNMSEASHIRSYENNSTSPADAIRKPPKPKSVTSQRHNNSKQISSFVSPSSLSKHMEEKKHKYEKAKVYVPDTNGKTKVQPNELQLFCPYLYPLIAGIPDPSYEFNTKDFDSSKSSVKIHIPIQMVCNKTNTKVIRMAEINAVNITLSEIYYEFNGGALTEVQPQTRVASADV